MREPADLAVKPADPRGGAPGPDARDGAAIAFDEAVEDLLLRGVCTRAEAEAEVSRMLRQAPPMARPVGPGTATHRR